MRPTIGYKNGWNWGARNLNYEKKQCFFVRALYFLGIDLNFPHFSAKLSPYASVFDRIKNSFQKYEQLN